MKANRIAELLETGKSKGVLTYKEIMDALEGAGLEAEQIEKIYETLENNNIDVVEDIELDKALSEDLAEEDL